MTYLRKHWTVALVLLVASLVLLLPATAAARVHVGVGVGFWGPVYPAYYGYWRPYPYWGPYYGGYYAPYYGGYYGYHRQLGEVKIKSPEPDARIYINGSLAGRAHDLKKFYLKPGTYDIEQRIDNDVQSERVYVLADRTLKIEFGHAGEGHYATPPPPRERGGDYYYDREREYERGKDYDRDRDYDRDEDYDKD